MHKVMNTHKQSILEKNMLKNRQAIPIGHLVQPQMRMPEISQICDDEVISTYRQCYTVNPTKSDITLTLETPNEDTWVHFKDVSNSPLYKTKLLCRSGVLIDKDCSFKLGSSEAITLRFAKGGNKFYIQ